MFKKLFQCKKNIDPDYLDRIEDLGHVFLVRLKGPLNIEALQDNRDKMTAVIDKLDLYSKNILVDLAQVTHTDSATIAALLDRFMAIEKRHHKVGLFNIPQHLIDLIDVLRVSHNFITYEDEATAIDKHKY